MAGIMEKFFGAKPDTTINPNTPTPGNIPNNASNGNPGTNTAAPNGVVPTETNTNTEVKPPLAEFADLWKNVDKDGKPVTPTTPEPLYKVDPKQIMEIAGKTDFKSVVTPEMLQKMVAGGQDGVAAMMDAMQKMSQAVYANAAVAATQIAESGIMRAQNQFKGEIPNLIKNQTLSESLAQKNPALRDPAVIPIVDLIRSQMAQKYPNASAQELQEQAERYFVAAGEAFRPQQQTQEVKVSPSEDWDTFFKL